MRVTLYNFIGLRWFVWSFYVVFRGVGYLLLIRVFVLCKLDLGVGGFRS